MTIWEALKALEEGKKVRYIDWSPEEYFYLNKSGKTPKIRDEHEQSYDTITLHVNGWELYEGGFIMEFDYDEDVIKEKCRYCNRVHTRKLDTTPYIYCPYCGKDSRIPVSKGE